MRTKRLRGSQTSTSCRASSKPSTAQGSGSSTRPTGACISGPQTASLQVRATLKLKLGGLVPFGILHAENLFSELYFSLSLS